MKVRVNLNQKFKLKSDKATSMRPNIQLSPIRQYKVDGEGLPIERKPKQTLFQVIGVGVFLLLFFSINYLFQVIKAGCIF